MVVIALLLSAFGLPFSPSTMLERIGEHEFLRIDIEALWTVSDSIHVDWGDDDGTAVEQLLYYLGALINWTTYALVCGVYVAGLLINVIMFISQVMQIIFAGYVAP